MEPSAKKPVPEARRRLWARLKALAWQVLAELSESPRRPLTVRARDGACQVMVTIGVVGDVGPAASLEAAGVQPFSVPELAILNALGPEGKMTTKRLARASGFPYGPDLKCRLRDLLERKALERDPATREIYWSNGYHAYRQGTSKGKG